MLDCDIKNIFVSFGFDKLCLQVLYFSFCLNTCIFLDRRVKFETILNHLTPMLILLATLKSLLSVHVDIGMLLSNFLGGMVVKTAILAT